LRLKAQQTQKSRKLMEDPNYEELARIGNMANNKANKLTLKSLNIPPGNLTFNVSHGNMGLKKNLASKTSVLRDFLIAGNIHVCFVSESGELDPKNKNLIQGYSIHNHCEKKNRGICWVIIDTFSKFTKIKYLNERASILTISTPTEKWTIVGIYGPHKNKPNFWRELEPKLTELADEDNVIILGDFNLHLMDDIPNYAAYLLDLYDLQKNKEFTFVGNSATNIDFTLVSPGTTPMLRLHKVLGIETTLSSSHSFIIDQFLNNNLPTPKFDEMIESDLLYKPNSIENCIELWKARPVLALNKDTTLEEIGKQLTNHIQTSVEGSFGVRPRHIANPYKQHLTRDQQKFVHRVDFLIKTQKTLKAFLKFEQIQTLQKLKKQYSYVHMDLKIPLPPFDEGRLKEISKTLGKIIKIEKREKKKSETFLNSQHLKERMERIKSLHKKDPRSFFQMAKPSHLLKKNFLTTVEHKGKFITNPTDLKQAVSDHYEQQFQETVSEKTKYLTKEFEFPAFKLPKITTPTLKELINKLPKRKSCGPDGIPYEILKMLREEDELEHLCFIINKCIEEKKIPNDWKLSRICLLHKDGDCNILTNYRPIALLNTIYKVLVLWINRNLVHHLEDNKIINQNQYGFRPNRSIYDPLNKVVVNIRRLLQEEKTFYAVFLDIEKAYDTVPIWGLKQALEIHNMKELADFITDVYTGAKGTVITPYGISPEFKIGRGVRQGCPLSPTLFNLFINMLLLKIESKYTFNRRNSFYRFYADDGIFITTNKGAAETFLKEVNEFLNYHGMKLSISEKNKTAVMTNDQSAVFTINNRQIPILGIEDVYRYLGIPLSLKNINTMSEAIEQCTNNITKYGNYLKHRCFSAVQSAIVIRDIITPMLRFKLGYIPITGDAVSIYSLYNVTVRDIMRSKLRIGFDNPLANYYKQLRKWGFSIPVIEKVHLCAQHDTIYVKGFCSEDSVLKEDFIENQTTDTWISEWLLNLKRHNVQMTDIPQEKSILRLVSPDLWDSWRNLETTHDSQFIIQKANTLNARDFRNSFPTVAMFETSHWDKGYNQIKNYLQLRERIRTEFNVLDLERDHDKRSLMAWTDGSCTFNKDQNRLIARSAVFFSDNHFHNSCICIPGDGSPYMAELGGVMGLLAIYKNITNLTVATDSLSAIQAIINTKKKWYKQAYWWIIDQIREIIKRWPSEENGQRTVNFKHVFSHTDRRGKHLEDSLKKIAIMEQKYGPEMTKTMIKGNNEADKLAMKNDDIQDVMLPHFSWEHKFTRPIFINTKTKSIIPNIYKYLKGMAHYVCSKRSQGCEAPGKIFPLRLTDAEADQLYEFTYKIITNKLTLNPEIDHSKQRTSRTETSDEDPICSLCFQEPEFWDHFLTCEANEVNIRALLLHECTEIYQSFELRTSYVSNPQQMQDRIWEDLFDEETHPILHGDIFLPFLRESEKENEELKKEITLRTLRILWARWKERNRQKHSYRM
jgi:hypothetical protein